MTNEKVNDIVPQKIIVNLKKDGTYKDAIMVYKIKEESGEINSKIYTIGINAQINKPVIQGMISNAKEVIKKKEKDFNN